jgi:ATP-dependent RNA helicase TDRD12
MMLLQMVVMRGCDIMVATPHCLLRMLQRGYTNLGRLCHIVLDGADVLTEHYTTQVHTCIFNLN